jgi:hypothetical protein
MAGLLLRLKFVLGLVGAPGRPGLLLPYLPMLGLKLPYLAMFGRLLPKFLI